MAVRCWTPTGFCGTHEGLAGPSKLTVPRWGSSTPPGSRKVRVARPGRSADNRQLARSKLEVQSPEEERLLTEPMAEAMSDYEHRVSGGGSSSTADGGARPAGNSTTIRPRLEDSRWTGTAPPSVPTTHDEPSTKAPTGREATCNGFARRSDPVSCGVPLPAAASASGVAKTCETACLRVTSWVFTSTGTSTAPIWNTRAPATSSSRHALTFRVADLGCSMARGALATTRSPTVAVHFCTVTLEDGSHTRSLLSNAGLGCRPARFLNLL